MTRWLRWRAAAVLPAVALSGLVGLSGAPGAAAGTPGVDPENVGLVLGPGQSAQVAKVVHTPEIPPDPDVVFLADTTGSMGSAIANVRTNAVAVMNAIRAAQPTSQFAVAQYRDTTDGPLLFNVDQDVTADVSAAQAAINTWHNANGGDEPEAYINALFRLSTGAVTFRPGSTRIIAMFGDAPSHDPSNGVTLNQAITALGGPGIRVVAVGVTTPGQTLGGLDGFGQATAITNATGGLFLSDVDSDDVADAILSGIGAIPVTVTPQVTTCSPNLSVSFAPGSRTVDSGADAPFTETVTVAAGAAPGTYACDVDFLIDGCSRGFMEHTTVTVPGLSVDDVSVTEGDSGTVPATFTVTLAPPSTRPVTVGFTTVNGTALAPGDYTAAAGTVTFEPGQTSQPVTVDVRADLVDEPGETFSVVLGTPVGAAIADGLGAGTILDDDRDGAFSCRASALNLVGAEPVVANAPDRPCLDATAALAQARLSAGILTVSANGLDASTSQTPDDLESAPPAAGDNAAARSRITSVTISTLLVTIRLDVIESQAAAECVAGPGGLVPRFTGTSTVAGLAINGVPVTVGSAPLTIPLVIGSLNLNQTAVSAGRVTQRAVFLDTLLTDLVLAESTADIEGTTAHPGGNPCRQ